MKLRGIEFGDVFTASGALNFFGDGYKFHKLLKTLFPKLFDFAGATFVAKTTPYFPNEGNMPLDRKLNPIEFLPNCIWVDPVKKIALNSVGLTSPGADYLFEQGVWQEIEKPFGLSFMAIRPTKEECLRETHFYKKRLAKELPKFKVPVFLQVNVSCPNTEHSPSELINEALERLFIFSGLGIPLDLKVNIGADVNFIKEVQDSSLCEVVTCSNTIPFGWMPDRIDWNYFFPAGESPLNHLGGGGLSGLPVFPLVVEWVKKMRDSGITMPLKLSNGIIYPHQVDIVKNIGGDAIEIGTVGLTRPMNVKRIINRANKIFGR